MALYIGYVSEHSISSTSSTAPSTPAEGSAQLGRMPISQVYPSVEGGKWPARSAAGEMVPITATVFREGHDKVGVQAVVRDENGTVVARERMELIDPGYSVFQAWTVLHHPGEYTFTVEAFDEPYATWHHAAPLKVAAGVDVDLMMAEGTKLLTDAKELHQDQDVLELFDDAIAALNDTEREPLRRLDVAIGADVHDVMVASPIRQLVTSSEVMRLTVMRRLAATSSWYEIFPRSVGASYDPSTGRWSSGTFKTAQEILPYIADLGFTVVYTPPIHPVGVTHRKGPNNTLTPGPADPGSPYAIGSADGGHDAVHPELGTQEDYEAFIGRARELGLEVALDIALQCSPDHPWVEDHPSWFTTRLDGTIAYAENPPKKYQDIYPLNFDNDPSGIYHEVRRVLLHWAKAGVTLFRIDNPHTKPVQFWEWVIAEVNAEYPDVIFLAEAFTKPEMMRMLAKVGFQQSYTYFAWRNTVDELRDYVTELSTSGYSHAGGPSGTADYMRPNFWPTTPDILTPYVQNGGRTGSIIRAVLAATLSPAYGIYGGYELMETTPRPGAEEHINSEKYEFHARDVEGARERGESIADVLKTLNQARATNPALLQLRRIRFHRTSHPDVIAYSHDLPARFSPQGEANTVITVVSVNPHEYVEGMVYLDMEAAGLERGRSFEVHDAMTGQDFTWGDEFYVRLGGDTPAHVTTVRPVSASE